VLAMLTWPYSLSALPAPQRHHTGEIAGIVQDAHGSPVEAAHVALIDHNHHTVAETTTDPHGHFHFRHVTPGHYTVTASNHHFGHGSSQVEVHAGEVAHVVVVIE